MAVTNYHLRYRPLCAGIMIFNPNVGRQGTLGFFGTSDDADRWLISAGHVLLPGDALHGGNPIYQPLDDGPENIIARTSLGRWNKTLDIAAVELSRGVDVNQALLGVGALGPPEPPLIGLPVMKAGSATGITEGVIAEIDQDHVKIVARNGYPTAYNLSGPGDSGALWVSQSSLAPVALHVSGNVTGPETAQAIAVSRVFSELRLRPLP